MPQSGALPHFVFFRFIFVFVFRFFLALQKQSVSCDWQTGRLAAGLRCNSRILPCEKIIFLFNLKLISSLNFKSSINSNHPEIQSLLKSLRFPHE